MSDVQRTKIIFRHGGYYVNRPNFDGGEVVPAKDYDEVKSRLDNALNTVAELLEETNRLRQELKGK